VSGDTNVVALLFVDHTSGMPQEEGWTTVNADSMSLNVPPLQREMVLFCKLFGDDWLPFHKTWSQAFLPRWHPHGDTASWVSPLYASRSFNYCTTYPFKHVCPYLIHKFLLRSLLPFLQVFFPCVLAHSFTSNLQKQWVVCTTHQHGITCLMSKAHTMHAL